MARVRAVNAAQLDEILTSDDPRPLLIDFTAEWCPPCRELAPELKRFARAEKHRLRVVKVDVDANEELAEAYGVQAMPTFVLHHDGAVVAKLDADLEQVSDLLDVLETSPLPAFTAGPGLGTRAAQVPHPARQLRLAEPLPGSLEITAQPGVAPEAITDQRSLVTETVIDIPAGHAVRLTLTNHPDLTALARLSPDTLDALLIHLDEGEEIDFTPVLHLTSLTDLQIWGQPLPADVVLGQLTQLTRLRHLEIPDDLLTTAELDALRAALPQTVINDEWISPALRPLLPVDEPVTAHLGARRHGLDHTTVYLTLLIDSDLCVHAPGSDDGLPLALALPDDSPWQPLNSPVFPATDDGLLSGTTLIAWDLTGSAHQVELTVIAQACEEGSATCQPPTTLTATCDVPPS